MSTEEFLHLENWNEYKKILIPGSLPTAKEADAFEQQLLNDDPDLALNGNNPLHIAALILAVTIPDTESTAFKLPSIKDIVLELWKKLPASARKTIKDTVKAGNTPKGRGIIVGVITKVLEAILGRFVPKLLLDIVLKATLPRAVQWIFDNIASLP